jgi:hypothetical protein
VKRAAIMALSFSLCSCSVIGKDTSLMFKSSLWQPSNSLSGKEIYRHDCQNNYYFEAEKKVKVVSQVYAFGFIIPLIPVIVPFRHYEESLKIKITVVGSASQVKNIIESANFYISSDGQNFARSASSVSDPYAEGYEKINFNRSEITIKYPINGKLPEYVYIKSDLVINGCKIPDIEYKLEASKYADFTLHMGP